MEVITMRAKVKPFTGKWCSRRTANRINDLFCSAQEPDRKELKKEAADFEVYMRSIGLSKYATGKK